MGDVHNREKERKMKGGLKIEGTGNAKENWQLCNDVKEHSEKYWQNSGYKKRKNYQAKRHKGIVAMCCVIWNIWIFITIVTGDTNIIIKIII